MTLRRTKADPVLQAEVWNELLDGRGIIEAYLVDPTHLLDGLCQGRTVYINPAPGIVEVAIHELVHRVRPRWGERRVALESRRILVHLGDRGLRRWYRQYQQVVRQRASSVRVGDC